MKKKYAMKKQEDLPLMKETLKQKIQLKAQRIYQRIPLRTYNGDVDKTTTYQWLSNSRLKVETEGSILAAQDLSLASRMCQAKILKNGGDPRCRLCTHSEETINHMISGCQTIVNTEYLQRHDRVAKFIHWTLCKHYEILHTEKWHEHIPESAIEGKYVTILWYFTVLTDKKIDANRTDIIIKNHEERTCIIMDVAVPSDQNISLKEFQKFSKYKDLEIEVTEMWKLMTKTIPVVIGALGMTKKGTQNFIDQIPGKPSFQEMQKIVLTSTSNIL